MAYPPEELNGFHTTTKPSTVNIRLLLLLPVHMNLIIHFCYAFWLSKKYKFHLIGGLGLRMAGLKFISRFIDHGRPSILKFLLTTRAFIGQRDPLHEKLQLFIMIDLNTAATTAYSSF